jgi:hypothetical protein
MSFRDLQDSWQWLTPYKGTPPRTSEVTLWDDGNLYRATQDQMRRADGRGWVWITDGTNTSGNKQSITADTRTLITIDGEGAATDTRFRDGLSLAVWSDDALRPQDTGETYMLRLQMKISPTTSSAGEYLELDLDVGGDLGIIWQNSQTIPKGQGVTDFISVSIPVFCLETFFTNGGQFYFTSSVPVNLWDKAIMIQRMSQP